MRSDGRFGEVDGAYLATPWEGCFWGYELRDGMLAANEGEAAWLLPEVRRPYWRGRIRHIEYEFAP